MQEDKATQELLAAKIPCEETGITVKQAICGVCGGRCLLDAYIKDGKVIKVEGNRSLPFSNGHICVKGAALRQHLYNPERLLYPMKRVGKRGEGKFERISWEEAFSAIADKLRENKEQHSAKETMIYVGHPKWFRPQLSEFAARYGTPNYGSESSTCAYAYMMAAKCCFGEDVKMPIPDVRNCKTLMVWGVNPMYSNPTTMGVGYQRAAESGKNIIVVDPRCTPTTEKANIHLRPIPGTDGALALGMARVLITEGLYDHEFVKQYTYGFEEYRDYVMEFTPERVERITGVPAEAMTGAARLFAKEQPSAIQMSASPVVHNINGVQNSRAIQLLCALTGSYGIPGGIMPPSPERAALKGVFLAKSRRRTDAEQDLSHEQFPAWSELIYSEAQVTRIADYLEGKGDYPIRMLLAFGMNHRMWPRPDRVEQAVQELDFFVNVDSFITETSRYADIILPAATSFEREQIEVFGMDFIYDQPQVVAPCGEVKNDMEIIIELSRRLGFAVGDPAIHSYEDYLKQLLEPTGITLEELRKHPEGMKAAKKIPGRTTGQIREVKTQTGKIEFVSQVLKGMEKPGHEALPVYHDFREILPMDEYPLILATGSRKPQLFHSRTYRMPWLNNLEPVAAIDIHPEDAAKLMMEQGEEVRLETPVGAMELCINLDSSCLKGMVNVYHGAGEKDINLLVDDKYLDPISGFPGFKSYCCRLVKKNEVTR